ncbi:MAG: DUF4330 domain-containing protein [Ruminiclostridium sp.]
MKIVNEKGKLFGLINIIDLSIIILILLVGSVFLLKAIGKDVGPIKSEQQNITVTFRGVVRVADQLKALKENDQLISILNPAAAYIKSITYNDLIVTNSTADGKQVTATDPLRKEFIVKFTMKTSGSGIIKLDTQEVSVGKSFFLKTHTFESNGTIEAIELN